MNGPVKMAIFSARKAVVVFATVCGHSVAEDAARFLQAKGGNQTTVQSEARASKTVPEAFGQGSSDPQKADGVLLHMISNKIVQDVKGKSLSFRDLIVADGDCGPTCSAWAYLRADMAPVAYLNDHWDFWGGADQMSRMSLIIDTSVVEKKLVTGMGITDSDTWHRSACRSMNLDFSYPGESILPACYIAPDGACAGNDCKLTLRGTEIIDKNAVDCQGDEVCQAVHSGNGIHLLDFPWWPQCRDTHEWDTCITTTEPCTGGECDVAFSTDPGSCQACSLPYFCDPKAAPGEMRIDEGIAIRIGVGSDATGFASQFFPDSNRKQLESKQCRWSPQDWSVWVERMKGMRDEIYKSFEASPWYSDYTGPYLENEVNLYVPPESSASYASVNAQWQDSLLGIGVDLQYCTERFPDSQQLFGKTSAEECADMFKKTCDKKMGCNDECDAIHAVFVKGCELSDQTKLPLYSTKLLTTLRPTELWKSAAGDVFEDITSKCKNRDSYYTCK